MTMDRRLYRVDITTFVYVVAADDDEAEEIQRCAHVGAPKDGAR